MSEVEPASQLILRVEESEIGKGDDDHSMDPFSLWSHIALRNLLCRLVGPMDMMMLVHLSPKVCNEVFSLLKANNWFYKNVLGREGFQEHFSSRLDYLKAYANTPAWRQVIDQFYSVYYGLELDYSDYEFLRPGSTSLFFTTGLHMLLNPCKTVMAAPECNRYDFKPVEGVTLRIWKGKKKRARPGDIPIKRCLGQALTKGEQEKWKAQQFTGQNPIMKRAVTINQECHQASGSLKRFKRFIRSYLKRHGKRVNRLSLVFPKGSSFFGKHLAWMLECLQKTPNLVQLSVTVSDDIEQSSVNKGTPETTRVIKLPQLKDISIPINHAVGLVIGPLLFGKLSVNFKYITYLEISSYFLCHYNTRTHSFPNLLRLSAQVWSLEDIRRLKTLAATNLKELEIKSYHFLDLSVYFYLMENYGKSLVAASLSNEFGNPDFPQRSTIRYRDLATEEEEIFHFPRLRFLHVTVRRRYMSIGSLMKVASPNNVGYLRMTFDTTGRPYWGLGDRGVDIEKPDLFRHLHFVYHSNIWDLLPSINEVKIDFGFNRLMKHYYCYPWIRLYTRDGYNELEAMRQRHAAMEDT